MSGALLAFGGNGQVGRELAARGVRVLTRAEADLTNPEVCAEAIRSHRPIAVINAAAYTAVDKAEAEADLAHRINAEAPGAMARACADLGVPLVQISTDYVFDGAGTQAFSPDAPTGPLGVYGQSKLAGEEAVRAAAGPHAILRTSWVFSAHGANFVKTMLRLGAERERLSIVADQIGGPTSAQAIAAACVTIAQALIEAPEATGTYHFSGARDVSWADFAREIFAQSGRAVAVDDIPTEAYPTPAARPKNSRLDCTMTHSVFGIERPDWRADLGAVLDALAQSRKGRGL